MRGVNGRFVCRVVRVVCDGVGRVGAIGVEDFSGILCEWVGLLGA